MTRKVITIKHQTGEVRYVVPYLFEELTIPELKKYVFRLLLDNLWVDPKNEETTEMLDAYLHEWARGVQSPKRAVKRAARILDIWEKMYDH